VRDHSFAAPRRKRARWGVALGRVCVDRKSICVDRKGICVDSHWRDRLLGKCHDARLFVCCGFRVACSPPEQQRWIASGDRAIGTEWCGAAACAQLVQRGQITAPKQNKYEKRACPRRCQHSESVPGSRLRSQRRLLPFAVVVALFAASDSPAHTALLTTHLARLL
jgi:hypothetical protein